ncbi:MAG: hypothetical protein H6565_01530 [Lewinellaceae bacterium]|nr:hypothetical protein [Lewinellaceae bacterium]
MKKFIIKRVPVKWILNKSKLSLLRTIGIIESDIFYANRETYFDEDLNKQCDQRVESGKVKLLEMITDKDPIKRKLAIVALIDNYNTDNEEIAKKMLLALRNRKDIVEDLLKLDTKTSQRLKDVISRMKIQFPEHSKHKFWDVIVDWGLLDKAWKISSEGFDFSIVYSIQEGEYIEIPADPAWGGGQNFMTVREPSENWEVLKVESVNDTPENPK